MLSQTYDLDRFFEALHDKTWIEILRATQDEIRDVKFRLGRRSPQSQLDPPVTYLTSIKEFEAYLLNPTDPLPKRYKTLVRKMRYPGHMHSSL